MLKETETEKNAPLCVIIFTIGGISIGEDGFAPPLPGYTYDEVGWWKLRHRKFHLSTACNTSIGFTAEVIFC